MSFISPAECEQTEVDVPGADAVVRVGKTRVTLDTIIMAFTGEATGEEIVQPNSPL